MCPERPHPLQERGDATHGADLADEVDGADIDSQLERRRSDERAELPVLETTLSVEAGFLRQASMMSRHRVHAEPPFEVPGNPLGQSPRVDKDKRRAVLLDKGGQPVVDLLPDLKRHHRLKRRAGHFDRQVESPEVSLVDDRAVGRSYAVDPARANKEARHVLDRPLGSRKTDPQKLVPRDMLKALKAERQVRATPRGAHRVNLVDDDRPYSAQDFAAAPCRQQQVQRLGCSDEDVGRPAEHRLPLRG